MKNFEIENIKKIISASIWDRVFNWKNIILIIGEIKNSLEQYDEKEQRLNSLEKEYIELKSGYMSELKLNENLSTKIKILENEKDILSPLKIKNIELTNELNKMKQEENSKDAIRESQIAKYEQFENNAREREHRERQEKIQQKEDQDQQIKRTWQDHEINVNNTIKLICQEEAITFVEDWHHEKKPDNVIKICDEYIVFDAKSPSKNQELNNFPTYIKDQVNKLSKYAIHEDVKKHLFLVVPENTIHALKVLTFNDSNYCVHVISPQALKITMWALKQIELYEFADKLSPEDRENLARVYAGSQSYIKRSIQIHNDLNEKGLDLIQQNMKLISKESLKGLKENALEFEKGDVVNVSKQNRGKIIDLEQEEIRQKEIKFKAKTRTLINPSDNLKKNEELDPQ
ncbi:MAG: hypothetical protein CMP54_00640 [Flavobacteriales bacterium]|nr:hypothetical protein [Flavobacteriales bacterium]|tara:strand:+ start:1574 stop:2779 length:1206 start_codon:yes stop_codon:yes gene_type:complete